ncbi:hypothetical protein PR202_gb00295 [Eleusine coracana subsp. coracana]|uniref:Uncharacterized protein n=1 Tax=Eleusine coracana subsp. coracana TaxID=191504 RepID=A0AAV5DTP2_ELECO|nr:hypothetical protein PR202_gb00295 [Eleusine coracana subsp. coracana]
MISRASTDMMVLIEPHRTAYRAVRAAIELADMTAGAGPAHRLLAAVGRATDCRSVRDKSSAMGTRTSLPRCFFYSAHLRYGCRTFAAYKLFDEMPDF